MFYLIFVLGRLCIVTLDVYKNLRVKLWVCVSMIFGDDNLMVMVKSYFYTLNVNNESIASSTWPIVLGLEFGDTYKESSCKLSPKIEFCLAFSTPRDTLSARNFGCLGIALH